VLVIITAVIHQKTTKQHALKFRACHTVKSAIHATTVEHGILTSIKMLGFGLTYFSASAIDIGEARLVFC